MREELVSESHSCTSDNHESRKEKIEKKRQIRKNKTQTPLEYVDLKSIDTSKLTREEKARVQKAKNREAAQRSRDTHREYVTNLELEVKELREQVNSRKLCLRCQKEIDESTSNDSSMSDQHIEERTKQEHKTFSLEKEEEYFFNQLQNPNRFDCEDSLLRVDEPDNDSYFMGYINLMGLVCVIALAVFVLWPSPQPAASSRALMQLPTQEPLKIQEPAVPAAPASSETVPQQNAKQTGVVALQDKGLIAFNSEDCINSLMTVGQPQDTKRSLRSYHDIQEEAYGRNYLANQQGILLCSVRTPKVYQQKYGQLASPLVKLYLLGSEIKEMITQSNLLLPIRDSNIQINGLYRVAAEVKDVSLVTDHNCLL